MHILLAVGVTLLTAGSPVQSQQAALVKSPPITVTFVGARLEDALSFLARFSGVTIEIDRSVTEETRRQPIDETPVRMSDASLEDAIATVTRLTGLSYSIVDARMVRVFKP